jgi:hypothetical protein
LEKQNINEENKKKTREGGKEWSISFFFSPSLKKKRKKKTSMTENDGLLWNFEEKSKPKRQLNNDCDKMGSVCSVTWRILVILCLLFTLGFLGYFAYVVHSCRQAVADTGIEDGVTALAKSLVEGNGLPAPIMNILDEIKKILNGTKAFADSRDLDIKADQALQILEILSRLARAWDPN